MTKITKNYIIISGFHDRRKNMIITFFGHSSLQNVVGLAEKIEETILKNISPFEKTAFYCGGYGDFDKLCAKVCRSITKTNSNCELIFITPYITSSQQEKIKDFISLGLYDDVIYPPLEKVPYKFAISRRNEWMVEQSDLIIAYVENSYGGAYKALEYAYRKKKKIINLVCKN